VILILIGFLRLEETLLQEAIARKKIVSKEFKSAQGRDGWGEIPKDIYPRISKF